MLISLPPMSTARSQRWRGKQSLSLSNRRRRKFSENVTEGLGVGPVFTDFWRQRRENARIFSLRERDKPRLFRVLCFGVHLMTERFSGRATPKNITHRLPLTLDPRGYLRIRATSPRPMVV